MYKGKFFVKSLKGWVKFKVTTLSVGSNLVEVRMGGLRNIIEIEITLGLSVMNKRSLEQPTYTGSCSEE